jgi:REP element-mobilizing transposase RayT
MDPRLDAQRAGPMPLRARIQAFVYNVTPPMAHTFSCLYFHVVFATKSRRALILSEVRPRMWSYMGGIARENRFRALAIGGMADHAHLLLSLSPTINISTAVQLVKAGSSGWIKDLTGNDFRWQEGYAAFTVSLSSLDSVKHYIDHQEEHHRRIDFATEWKLLLEKHGIVLPAR